MRCWSARSRGRFVLSQFAWLSACWRHEHMCQCCCFRRSATARLSLLATGRPSFLSPTLAAGSTLQPAANSDTATSALVPEEHSGQPVPFWAQQYSHPSISQVNDVRQAKNPTQTVSMWNRLHPCKLEVWVLECRIFDPFSEFSRLVWFVAEFSMNLPIRSFRVG